MVSDHLEAEEEEHGGLRLFWLALQWCRPKGSLFSYTSVLSSPETVNVSRLDGEEVFLAAALL